LLLNELLEGLPFELPDNDQQIFFGLIKSAAFIDIFVFDFEQPLKPILYFEVFRLTNFLHEEEIDGHPRFGVALLIDAGVNLSQLTF
jgi:hypothetical protein